MARFLYHIKHGATKLTEEQRDRLLALDPQVLDIKPISHAAKTMTKDQKIDSLIAFYYQYGRWPMTKETDPDTGLLVGKFRESRKHR